MRKLTEREEWRLMGFTDEQFDRAKESGVSSTQLYKQAGNSIVVNVLSAVFGQMNLKKKEDPGQVAAVEETERPAAVEPEEERRIKPMKAQELTINIDAHVGPSEESAQRALQILNWYLKDNPDIEPSITRVEPPDAVPYRSILMGSRRKGGSGQ